MNRRSFIYSSTFFSACTALSPGVLKIESEDSLFKIGACDWSIGYRGQLEAFAMAKQLGLDGLQISFRVNPEEALLEDDHILEKFRQESTTSGIEIASLALGILNQIPYKSDKRAEQWVSSSIDAAVKLGTKVVLLAFFGDGNIKDDPEGTRTVITRLKNVVEKAERAGIILGLESWLSASEHVEIIDAVGSDNVKVYYDVANSNKMGYDIYEEIRWLGKDLICELHAKENGYLLGAGKIDFTRVRQALDDIGYEGWIQIEGALPKGADIYQSYKENVKVMRKLF